MLSRLDQVSFYLKQFSINLFGNQKSKSYKINYHSETDSYFLPGDNLAEK